MICERDSLNDNNQIGNQSKTWFFINAEWLSQWKMFILNKMSKDIAARVSPNSKIGILPPGPISNLKLLRQCNQKQGSEKRLKPKQGLKKFIDYRGVNERVWNLFLLLYSGGPCIVGKQYDIYQKVQVFVKKSEKVLQQQKRMNYRQAKTDLINKSQKIPQNVKFQLLKKQEEKQPQIFGNDPSSFSLAKIQSFNQRLTDQNVGSNAKNNNIFKQEQKRSGRFNNVRNHNPNKMRGQSANISPFSRNPQASKRLNQRNDWQWIQRKKNNYNNKKQHDSSYLRKQNGERSKVFHLEQQEPRGVYYKMRSDRLVANIKDSPINNFDSGNGQLQCRFQKKEPEKKKDGTLNKFVGIMRNIFNKQ